MIRIPRNPVCKSVWLPMAIIAVASFAHAQVALTDVFLKYVITCRWRITEITQLSAFGMSFDNASAIDNN